MIGAICAAIGGAVLNNAGTLLVANSAKPKVRSQVIRSEIAPTQFVQLQPSNIITSPHDRMHTQGREEVITLASQAYATSGNPFWARKRMQQEEESIPSYAMAL